MLTIPSFRHSEHPQASEFHQFSSDAAIQAYYLLGNTKAQENFIVIQWLQDSLEIPNEPTDIRGSRWMYTKRALQYARVEPGSNHSTVSELDTDASLRQQKPVSNEDEQYDRTIFKYIFELIRARKYNIASKFAKLTGNYSLLLAMKGIDDYVDPDIEGDNIGGSLQRGVIKKALWRRMCWQLSQSPNIDPYERGIYGVLSSDINSVMGLSDTWELQFLAYMSCLVATEAEEILVKHERIEEDVLAMRIPGGDFKTPLDILSKLSSSNNPQIRQDSEHVYRRYIADIIQNNMDSVVDFTVHYVDGFVDSTKQTAENADNMGNALRTAVHILLFLQILGSHPGTAEKRKYLIRSYIELLRSKGKSELAPLYVSYLPDEDAIDSYSSILAAIEDNNEREIHIELANKYGLDLHNTIRRVVKRVFEENSNLYSQRNAAEFTYEVSESDIRICKATEWFFQTQMWPDCIHSGVSFYRMFLLSGKVQAAKEFGKIVSFTDALKHMQSLNDEANKSSISPNMQLELKEYLRLMDCLELIDSWNEHYSSRTNITDTWKFSAIETITSTSDLVHELCHTWLIDVINTGDNSEEVSKVRTRYIPFLLNELLRMFVEAQVADFNFLKQAVNLVTFVSSEDFKLYELLLESGTLNVFLDGLAGACADGVKIGEKGIFD